MVLEGWEESFLPDKVEEEEEDDEEEGLESPLRPSSSFRELNSSSCLCCSSNKDAFPLPLVAAVLCPGPCPTPRTRPVPCGQCP